MSHSIEQHPVVRRLKWKRRGLGALSFLISVLTMYVTLSLEWAIDLSSTKGMELVFTPWMGDGFWWLVIAIVGILMTTLSVDRYAGNSSAVQVYPYVKDAPGWLNNANEICEMVGELSGKLSVNIDRVYVVEQYIPNAFASFVFHRGHVVILYRNLLEIMDDASLRSVLAHEMAHAKSDDVLHRMINILPRILMGWVLLLKGVQLFGVLLLSNDVWTFLVRGGVLVGYASMVSILLAFIQWWENQYSQIKENLADVYGAAYTSVEGSINAFLRLNDRSHMVEAVTSALNSTFDNVTGKTLETVLSKFPTGAKDVKWVMDVAIESYIENTIRALCVATKVDKGRQADVVSALKSELLTYVPSVEIKDNVLPEPPFAWKEFDWNHDGFLQGNELSAMVQALLEDPIALTDKEGSGTHPPTRERILLLATVFADNLK